ncbi:hypothetical protein ACLB2K_066106 [Fragaria x ananassa]
MAEFQVAIDRFGELPPEIAHHILSFLPIADVTRVSSLSKRCSRLHLSNPTVNFHSFPSESTLTFQKRLKLWNSLDRFLVQRRNNKVKSFFVYWNPEYHFAETEIECHCVLEKRRILGWIRNALRCNVEELTVFFRTEMPTVGHYLHGNDADFPSSVFLCESLRFIKDLRLEQVYGLEDITIERSSLESFSVRFPCYFDIDRLAISGYRIKDIDINWEYDPTRNNNTSVLYISAPNLKYLKWAVPNLTTLAVSSYPEFPFLGGGTNLSGFDKGYWELQRFDFVGNLEQVTMELTSGSNGYELAKYLLEHACSLKMMWVITTPDQSSLVPEIRRRNRTSNTTPDQSSVGYELVKFTASSSCLMTKSHVEMNV